MNCPAGSSTALRADKRDVWFASDPRYSASVFEAAAQRRDVTVRRRAEQLLHWSFDDPAAAEGDEAARLAVFRRVRDEIRGRLREFIPLASS